MYIRVADELSKIPNPSQTPMAWMVPEGLDPFPPTRIVLFYDAHVETVDESTLRSLLPPEVDFDAMEQAKP